MKMEMKMLEQMNLFGPVETTLGALFLLLAIASVTTALISRFYPSLDVQHLRDRVSSWWVLTSLVTLSLLLGREVTLISLAVLSFISLREYFSIIPTRNADRRVLFWAYMAIPIQYFLAYTAWYKMFISLIPCCFFLFFPARMVLIGDVRNFLAAVSSIQWGVMLNVFNLSHIAYLLNVNVTSMNNPNGGDLGLVLFLIIITEMNDVAQFVTGKILGKHKVMPKVSPNKTWEGLAGGILFSAILSACLSVYLTPILPLTAMLLGIVLSVAGFLGDVTVSAIKRDMGVKDSGTLIPGHGGVLDRVDSLTFTSPVLFHIVHHFYFYGHA